MRLSSRRPDPFAAREVARRRVPQILKRLGELAQESQAHIDSLVALDYILDDEEDVYGDDHERHKTKFLEHEEALAVRNAEAGELRDELRRLRRTPLPPRTPRFRL